MAIKDLLKPADPEQLIQKLVSDAVNAKNRFDAANTAWADALADEAEGLGDPGRTERAERALDAARKAHEASRVALDTARSRAAANSLKTQQEATAAAWRRAEALVQSRLTQVAKLAKSAEKFAHDYHELLRLTQELNDALPWKPQILSGALLVDGEIFGAVSSEMDRLGATWTGPRPSKPLFEARPLAAFFEGNEQIFTRWREQGPGRIV